MLAENLGFKTVKYFLKLAFSSEKICYLPDLSHKYSGKYYSCLIVIPILMNICFRELQEISSEFAINLSGVIPKLTLHGYQFVVAKQL